MRWEIFDKFYNAHWFLTGYSCRNFSELLRDGGSTDITKFIGVMDHDVNFMIFNPQQFDQAAHFYANKLINDHKWRRRMYVKHDYYLRRYFQAGEKFRKLPFHTLSDKQLIRLVKPMTQLQEQVRILGVTINGLVIDGRNHLSTKLRKELHECINDEKNFDAYWSLLTQVTRLSMRQKKDMAIAQLVRLAKRQDLKKVEQKLQQLHERYCWLDYMYYGPPVTLTQYRDDLQAAIQNNVHRNLRKELQTVARKQRALIKKLKLTPRARHLIRLAQHVLWQKGRRKDVEYHGFYCYEPFFREVARRKGIEDWRDFLYLLPWELEKCILKDAPDAVELKERRKFSCLIVDLESVTMLVGKKARNYYQKLHVEKDLSHLTETKGQCAYAGTAKGRVKIIQVPEDMKKMERGDIIVSQATSPDLLSAMKKAAAIVTNTGGLICHAAITSRELKIPCVVGTNNATLIFQDGDRVEVNATKGIVKKL